MIRWAASSAAEAVKGRRGRSWMICWSSSSSISSLPSKAIRLIEGFSTTSTTIRFSAGITRTSWKSPVSNSRRTAAFRSSAVTGRSVGSCM